MKGIFISLIICFFFNQELVDYSNDDYYFSIKLPKGYEIEKNKYEEKFASIEYVRIAGSEKSSNRLLSGNLIYRVICYKYSRKPIINTNKLNFHDVIIAYSKQQNENSFVANNLTVKSKNESNDTLYYILSDESKGLLEHRKLIVHDSLTYCLSIMSNKDILTPEYVAEFFNSLKIKK